MNDYTLEPTKDSYDLAHRDHERYQAERELSDVDWEEEREVKIESRCNEMLEDDEYLREVMCSDEILYIVRSSTEGNFSDKFTTVVAEVIWEMAAEEIDKGYS